MVLLSTSSPMASRNFLARNDIEATFGDHLRIDLCMLMQLLTFSEERRGWTSGGLGGGGGSLAIHDVCAVR